MASLFASTSAFTSSSDPSSSPRFLAFSSASNPLPTAAKYIGNFSSLTLACSTHAASRASCCTVAQPCAALSNDDDDKEESEGASGGEGSEAEKALRK